MTIELLTVDLERAVAALRRGGLVGMPTETVYGLAADAADGAAIRRLFAVKGRPTTHPLILHVDAVDALGRFGVDVPDVAWQLAGTCWPGPLSLLVRRAATVLDAVTGGRDSVAIRMPAHPMALGLLARFGGPVVAPSANRFGHVSPTTARHVLDGLGDLLDVRRDVVLDGGATAVGLESTIVDCTTPVPEILRPGAITAEQVAAIAGEVASASGPARAPGMLARHYSPAAAVELVDDKAAAMHRAEALWRTGRRTEVIDVADLVEYARSLYSRLRAADSAGVDVVIAVLPPPVGLGYAIRDRLERASAGR